MSGMASGPMVELHALDVDARCVWRRGGTKHRDEHRVRVDERVGR